MLNNISLRGLLYRLGASVPLLESTFFSSLTTCFDLTGHPQVCTRWGHCCLLQCGFHCVGLRFLICVVRCLWFCVWLSCVFSLDCECAILLSGHLSFIVVAPRRYNNKIISQTTQCSRMLKYNIMDSITLFPNGGMCKLLLEWNFSFLWRGLVRKYLKMLWNLLSNPANIYGNHGPLNRCVSILVW
jgi:hypothetical protein